MPENNKKNIPIKIVAFSIISIVVILRVVLYLHLFVGKIFPLNLTPMPHRGEDK
jgi:hypothetical protein